MKKAGICGKQQQKHAKNKKLNNLAMTIDIDMLLNFLWRDPRLSAKKVILILQAFTRLQMEIVKKANFNP